LYSSEVIADQCSNFGHKKTGECAFSGPPLKGIGATYTVHVRLTGKLVVPIPVN